MSPKTLGNVILTLLDRFSVSEGHPDAERIKEFTAAIRVFAWSLVYNTREYPQKTK